MYAGVGDDGNRSTSLLLTKPESGEEVAIYNPRLMRQLGHDQGAMRISGVMTTFDVIVAEAWSIGKGKDQTLANIDELFWPASRRVSMRSPGGALYWRKCIEGIIEEEGGANRRFGYSEGGVECGATRRSRR